MKIMEILMALDGVEGTKTIRDFIESSGTKETNSFTYWQPFEIKFGYIHQVYNQNNRINAPIYLERHGRPSSSLIKTLTGMFLCKRLIQMLCQVTFKMMGYFNQFCNFRGNWQHSGFRIQLRLNW